MQSCNITERKDDNQKKKPILIPLMSMLALDNADLPAWPFVCLCSLALDDPADKLQVLLLMKKLLLVIDQFS